MPLAQAIALTFIAPLIALLLASVFLNEQIGSRSILGSIAAFGGVVIIVLGQARSHLGPDALLGTVAIIGSALCYAVNIVLMRHQALAAKPLEITFFQAIFVMAVWILRSRSLAFRHGRQANGTGLALLPSCRPQGHCCSPGAMPAGRRVTSRLRNIAPSFGPRVGLACLPGRVSFYTLAGAVLIVGGCLVAARRKMPVPPEIDVAA